MSVKADVPDRAEALRVGRAILEAHGVWETENSRRGSQDLWGEQHVILLGQAAMLSAAPVVSVGGLSGLEDYLENQAESAETVEGAFILREWARALQALAIIRGGDQGSLPAASHPSVPICAEDIARIIDPECERLITEAAWAVDRNQHRRRWAGLIARSETILALIHQAATPDGSGALVLDHLDKISALCTSFNAHRHDPDLVLGKINQLAYGCMAALRPSIVRPLPAAPEGGK